MGETSNLFQKLKPTLLLKVTLRGYCRGFLHGPTIALQKITLNEPYPLNPELNSFKPFTLTPNLESRANREPLLYWKTVHFEDPGVRAMHYIP